MVLVDEGGGGGGGGVGVGVGGTGASGTTAAGGEDESRDGESGPSSGSSRRDSCCRAGDEAKPDDPQHRLTTGSAACAASAPCWNAEAHSLRRDAVASFLLLLLRRPIMGFGLAERREVSRGGALLANLGLADLFTVAQV